MDEQQINNEERSRTSIDVAKEVANAMEIETVGHISALRDEAARRESAVATYMIWRDSQLPLVLKEFDAELTRCAKQASTLATALAEMAASNDEQFKEPATVLESLEGSSKRALDDLERSHCQLVELRGLLEFVRHGDEAPLRLASETTFTADTRASRVFFTRAFTLWQMVTRWTEMHVRWLSQPLVALDAAELDAESLRFASESQKLLARLNAPPHADTLVYFSADLGDETIKISGSPQLEAHHGSAAETLVKETREFRALAPIAVDLRNPSLKSRHWTKIGTQVMADQTATLTLDPTITSLGELVEFGIKNHGDYIHHVSTASSAEAKLEAAIVELEGAWDLMCLPVVEVAGGRDVSKIMGHEDTMSESQPDYRSSCGTSIRSDDSKIGERERFELGPLDDVVALINEHREFLRNAALGEHGAALRPLIAAWRARLDMLSETVQTAEELSRLIRSLESLLGDLKVRDQLAHARMRFANISGKWKSLLPYWHKCPKPMLLVTAPGGEHSRGDSLEMSRLDNRPCDEVAASLPPAPCDDQLVSWKQDLAVLDELRRELNEHVAQKRDAFPRFFFLSDRVLLKTLSELQSSSARRTGNVLGSVARVLPSLFNAVAEVEGELDSEGVDMLQSAPTVQRIAILVDAVGERLVLDSPVPIVGPPEGWLLHLEKEIVETLRTAFVAAIKQRSRARGGKRLLALAAELTIIKSEDADAEDIPLQAALLAERLVWTAEVGKALAATVRPGGTDGAMLRIARDCATVAAEYAAELRHRRFSGVAHNGQAEPAVCAKKEALVVLAIHHRDTATAIASAAQHLTSLDDWTWQSQLRFYVVGNPEARRRATPLLRGKTRIEEAVVSSLSTNSAETPHLMRGISDLGVVARQVNAVLPIGAEYLGCGTRVVVTPLGGRCALALATVMDSLQGIALVGPRGVGKREIVKGLAATFYFQCVERCCADFGLKAEATVASLGRVFAGIASTGAWFILALSDRREPRVLQTLAAYMHTLQVAVATRSPTVYFPGGVTVPLKPFARAESPKNEEYHQHAHHAGMPLIAITATYEVPSWRPVFVPVPEVVAVARAELVVRGFEITTAVRTSNALAVILRLAVDARLGGGTDLEVHARWSLRTVRSVVCDATERLHVIRNGKQWGTSIVAVKCVAGLGLDDDDDDERKPPTPEDFAIVEAQEARALRAAALAIMMLPLVDRADCDLLRDIVSASLPASDKTADDGLDQKTCRVTSGAFVTVCGGEPSFQQLEAALALDDALVVSAGVALVGPAGAGKSTILRAVCSARAQATESVDADVHFVVAASLTLADVFGSADDACGAGIIHRFISCARHHLRNTADDVVHEQWIVFDGLTEAHLACEMFVVLFDRAEGMCASMSASDIRFVVETDSFAAASPALISRLGVISLPPFRESRPLREGPSPAAMRALAWLQLSQLEQALCEFGLDEVVDNLRGFFEDPACPLDTALAVARRVDCQTYFDPADLDMEPQLYLEDNDARRVSAMCSLLAALLDPSGKDEDADPPDEIGVTCAVAWAIAWGVLGHAIAVEDVQKWLKARFRELAGDDPQIEAACAGLVPGREIDDNIPWQSYSNDFLYVPTPRDESALFTLSLLAKPFVAPASPDDLRTVFRAMCGDAKHKQGFNHIMEMVVAGCSLRAAVRVARGLELGRDLSLSRVAAHELFQEFGGNRVEESLLVVNGHHYVDSSQSVEAQVGPSLESLNAGLAETRQPPSGVVLSPATGHARHVALAARAMALDAPLVLVGPQGIGRRSCVQLAAHLVGVSQVFHAPPPPISLNGDMIYMPTEDGQLDSTRCTAPPDGDAGWLETLRKASMAATTNGAVLVIADSAWAHSPLTARRLDDLKTVLATGYVARALRPEDIQKLVTDFEDDSKLKTREDQTYAALLTYAEPASRLALKAFIPLAVVDTFDEWGVEAFAAVGKAGDKHGGVGLHRAMAAATVGSIAISGVVKHAGVPIKEASERHEAAVREIELTGDALDKARRAYRGALGETLGQYDDALKRLFSAFADNTNDALDWSSSTNTVVRPIKLVLEGLSILLQDKKPSWEQGYARYTGERDATDQLVKWAIAAADAAAGTTSSDQPPEAIRKRWKDIVTAAEAVMSDPSAAPATMKRVGSQGLNLGYPVATWVQAAIDLFRATMMQQAVAKWRLYLKAKVADDMAREKLLLAADAALAAKTVQAAAKELSNLMKTLVGENDNEINAIQAKQRVSCERFMELETTFNRWDARRASLAADHARLSNVAAAAAAAATYATALNMREDFLRAVARLTCVDIEWHWDVEPSTNRATYVALPRAAPALCDALSEDEACDFGGCGEGGLAYRAWNARGILPGGVCGDFALAATAAATERLRITLFADASGDGARWLLGAYDRKKLWTSASSSLVRVYLNEEGHAYMALPLLKARKPESRRRRVSSRRAAAQRSEMPKLETQVAPVVSALHAALTIGAAVVLVELPDAFFASPAAFRAFFEPLEPLLRARIDRELAATTDPPLSRVLKNHFGTSDIVNDPEQDCSRSRLVLRAAVPAETIREVSQGSSVAAALSLVETASNVATRLVEGALEALPPVEPPYGGLVAAERRFTEGALLATIAAREQDDALLELAARQDPGAIFVLPDNETGESNTPPLLAAARLRFGLERKAAAAVSDLAKTINALDAARRDLVPSAQATADVVDTCPLSSHVARFAAVVRHACKSCDGLTRPEFDPCEAALAAWLLERPSLSAEQVLPQALATALRTSQRTHGAFREELLCHPPHLAKELEAELPTELRGLSVVASDASWQAALDDAPETWLFATERAPAAVRAFFHALHPAVKLMVARVLRPERFVSVARALVAAVLGQEVVDDRIFLVQPVDQWPPVAPDSRFAPRYVAEKQRGTAAFAVAVLKHAAEAAGPAAPVVVRCVGGTGPPLVAVLETAARQMQWLRQPNVVDVSVGFPSAEANDEACAAILAAAFETGDWVVVRAARSCWMPTLLAQLDVADVVAATTKHPLIPSHRLFVVADQVSFDIVSRCGATVVLEAPSTPRARLAVSLADDGGVFAPSIFPQLLDVEQRAFYAQALLRALAAGREDLAPSALVTWCGFAATESEPSPGASILSDELVFARACRRAHLVLFQSQEPNLASPQLARHAPNIAALSALGKRALDAAQTAGTSPSWLTAPSYRDVNAVKDYVCGLPNYDDDNDDANGLVARAIPVSQSPAEAEKHRPSVVVDRIAEVSARLSEVSARLAEACRATGWSAALWRQELEYLGHAYAAGDLVSEAQHEVLVATWPRHGGFPEKGLPLARLARPERFFVALRLAAGGSLGSFACALHEPAHAGAVRICGLHLGGAGALGESGFLDEMEPQDAAGRDLLALWVWVDEECSVPPASTVDDLGAMLLERPIFVPPSNTTSSPAASKSTTYECPLYRDTSRADLLAMLRLPTHRSPDHWALRGCALFLDGAA
ncbi:hypothetical protein CTAYLR_010410 [Chrysophaeum taylorii]|uniref:AAA+ ATPase domain-containing protein n=1 Tax=Chrysophaeum taylorii TaxID=2483200 RepID=A0AAD7UIY0_9STRA|nr:hypothetical protein CTAYLR_010410 [Chrysophaeum taylorii]